MSKKLSIKEVEKLYNFGEGELEKKVNEIVKDSKSKSKMMKELYMELEIDVSSVRDILVDKGIEVSYNFVYNVVSRSGMEIRRRNKGESKSKDIRRLYNEGYKVKDIVKWFVLEKGEYCNENYVRSVIRKEKEKKENKKK